MSEVDFSKICRVCCIEGTLISLFKVHLSKKLMSCASIQVWQNDGLPGQICTKCIAKLQIAYQFKKVCEKSDVKLRQYIVNRENGEKKSHKSSIITPNIAEQQAQNDYIYIDCTPAINEVRSYNSLPMNINNNQVMHPLHINYNNHVNSYSLQNVNISNSLQLQNNINGPLHVQTSASNHIYSLGEITGNPMPLNNSQMQTIFAKKPNVQAPLLNDKTTRNIISSKIIHKIDKINKIALNDKLIVNDSKACPICGKHFAMNSKLSRHMKTHSNEMLYRCDICQKGFTHSGNCKVHMRMHTNERPYLCRICNKGFRQQQDLDKHMRTHTGERPHICQICNKGFSTSSNLIAHIRTHSGEKPYVCSICAKGFCQSNELTKHLRTHSGEKSHICKICHKGFNGSSTLVVHMRSHTGERPYICNICQKAFTQSSCLQVHLKRHIGEKNYHCKICFRSFITNANLKEHMLIHKTEKQLS